MTNIRDLFKKREDIYTEYTQKIILAMKNVVAGVHDVVGEQGEFITWKVIEYFDDDEQVMLAGVIILPDGFVLKLNNKEVIISDKNRTQHVRFLRVGLPMNLVETGSRNDIAAYLRENLEGDIQGFNAEMDDFALEQLTPEQLQQLQIFSDTTKGKLN